MISGGFKIGQLWLKILVLQSKGLIQKPNQMALRPIGLKIGLKKSKFRTLPFSDAENKRCDDIEEVLRDDKVRGTTKCLNN